jgi:flagellar export protein FliJ
MKPFRFRLESVRSLRELDEQKRREKLAQAAHALREAEDALGQARTAAEALAIALASQSEKAFRAIDKTAALASLSCAEAEIKRREATREEAVGAKKTAYVAWVEAHQALEVIERLAERQKRHHQQEALRAEQAELDEFAGLLASRQRMAS